MSKRLELENEFGHLWFHPESKIVHQEFHKFIWGDAFRTFLGAGLELLVRERASKWLSENRDNTAHSREDTDWATREWQPYAAKSGWKYWAIVLPEDIVGRMNMERIVAASVPYGVNARVLPDVASALAWLEQVDVTA